MKRPTHGGEVLLFAALIALPSAARAQIVSPETSAGETRCGPAIKKAEVLVLDLERFGSDAKAADEFIGRYVTKLKLESETPETIRTSMRSARKSRMSAMKRAQTTAAERGCNVVLVFRAWEGDNEASYAQALPGGQAVAVGLHYAYASAVFGLGERVKR